jgi:hypothetical protein
MNLNPDESSMRDHELVRMSIVYGGVPGSFILSYLAYFDVHGSDLRYLFSVRTLIIFLSNLVAFGLFGGFVVGRVLTFVERRLRRD